MKTEVETYLIEETVGLIYDNEQLERWNSHVKDLGLTGQQTLSKPEKSPIPFMHMKQTIISVFETLCPRKVDVSVYDKTPIPVEVLELIALSKREQYFEKIQIWFDDKDPDPACIGINPNGWYVSYDTKKEDYTRRTKQEAEQLAQETGGKATPFSWDNNHYLIGRWADVKRPIDELKDLAKKRWMETEGAMHRKAIKEAEAALHCLEEKAIEKFN